MSIIKNSKLLKHINKIKISDINKNAAIGLFQVQYNGVKKCVNCNYYKSILHFFLWLYPKL